MIDLEQVKRELKPKIMRAMRMATPKDTGNLAYRAMRGYINKDGIKVVYDGNIAGYGKILNQTLYRQVKTGNYKRMKKNKHFGWHNRASNNGHLIIYQYFGGDKRFRPFDTKQTYRFPMGTQEGVEAKNKVYQKWLNNKARQRYEKENVV
jgi:hypothetical protein